MSDVRQDMHGLPGCDEVREYLPLRVAGVCEDGAAGRPAAEVEAHLAACADCADELAFLEILAHARPSPPSDLAVRVVARALGSSDGAPGNVVDEGADILPFRSPRRTARWSGWWANPAAAAAVLVLAVGMGLVARVGTPGTDNAPALAFDAQAADMWAEDWLVAGAPYLDGVSDETLALLVAGIDP